MADPATATATSSRVGMRFIAAALALAGAAALAACGGSSGGELTGPPAPSHPAAFSWVHPQAPGAGWQRQDLPSGNAALVYPAGWKLIRTDPGTVTATLKSNDGIAGYLNVTPQQGEESLANWASFRPAHNAEEGDRNLVPIASATGLPFRVGTGSCVKDSYRTGMGRPYVEVACIVRGSASTNVIVAAAPPDHWKRLSPLLERSISSSRL